MRACVCACVLCGNVGSACSPRATRINALQTKCSPFTLFCCLQRSMHPPPPSTSPLSGHCWARRRRQSRGTGYAAAGKHRNKAECDAKYTSGFDNAELSRCLPAAFSVWCWERSIYSTQSYAPRLCTYITHQLSSYFTVIQGQQKKKEKKR